MEFDGKIFISICIIWCETGNNGRDQEQMIQFKKLNGNFPELNLCLNIETDSHLFFIIPENSEGIPYITTVADGGFNVCSKFNKTHTIS